MLPLCRAAARRLCDVSPCRISPEDRETVTSCLLDVLGAVLDADAAGLPALPLPDDGGRTEAHLWGKVRRASIREAAFANAVLGHSLIRDDMHPRSGSHPGSIVLPALIALAEREKATGEMLGTAVFAGYGMMGALGIAMRAGGVSRSFRPSGLVGAFGAAAGAAVLMGLDEDGATSALSFAANMAAGVNEWPKTGGFEGLVHMGFAAQNGLQAADLARVGMVASETALDGDGGLFRAYTLDPAMARDAFAAALPTLSTVGDIRFKAVPGCSLIQSPIAAALKVASSAGFSSHAVAAIRVGTNASAKAYPGCDSHGPFTSVVQAKMSMPFAVAAALRFGRLDEAAYRALDDPELLRLVRATRIEVDPALVGTADRQAARVTVALKDGGAMQGEVAAAPWLDHASVERRFRQAAVRRIAPAAADRLLSDAKALWSLPEIGTLIAGLAGDPQPAYPRLSLSRRRLARRRRRSRDR